MTFLGDGAQCIDGGPPAQGQQRVAGGARVAARERKVEGRHGAYPPGEVLGDVRRVSHPGIGTVADDAAIREVAGLESQRHRGPGVDAQGDQQRDVGDVVDRGVVEVREVAALPFEKAAGEVIEGWIAGEADEPAEEGRIHGADAIAERRHLDDVAEREQQRIDEQDELETGPEQRAVEQLAPCRALVDSADEPASRSSPCRRRGSGTS